MKIGIITHFHKSINYGGVLQAYALCKFLNDNGYSAQQILYTHKSTPIEAEKRSLRLIFGKLKSRIERKLYAKRNKAVKARMENAFCEFRNSIPHTEKEYTRENVAELSGEFDAFITGSDQVWNPFWYDPSYMLNFVNAEKKRISYAASMGVSSLSDREREVFKKELNAFDGLSVREGNAATLLSDLLERDVTVTVDPTLLLTKETWDSILPERKISEKYVFTYLLGNGMKARKLAKKFADKKGLKLVSIPDLLGAYRKCDRKNGAELVFGATPADFISLIKNAEYVITDSFHASVFSILYHKNFFAFQRGGKIKMGSRIHTLLQMFGCTDRFISEDSETSLEHLLSLESKEYSNTPIAFLQKKNASIDYLNINLG